MFLILAALVATTPPPAGDFEVALLVAPGGVPNAVFVDALRIQLAGSATVRTGLRLEGETLQEKVDAASMRIRRGRSSMVVWLDQRPRTPTDHADFVLYVVGGREPRLLKVARLANVRIGPEVYRALALKVRDLVDAQLLFLAIRRTPATERPTLWQAELGAGWAPALGAPTGQFMTSVGIGVARPMGAFRGELIGQGSWASSLTVTDDAGRVDATELGAGLGARMLWRLKDLEVGATASLTARFVKAEGTTPSGAADSARITFPTFRLAGVARHRSGRLSVQVSAGIEAAVVRQRFLINEEVAVDLGRVRPTIQVSLIFTSR